MAAAKLVGLMSGTSVDAIDAALVAFENDRMELLHTLSHPIPATLRDEIASLSHPGDNEIERLGQLDRALGSEFAAAALALLSASATPAREVSAIGCHGQTVRHHPPSSGLERTSAFSLQIGDPNTIAERTGITTVADFRRRDIAAGGEGAPLAPAFHAALAGSDRADRAIVNIGGIANITLLGDDVTGFDTGPGNTLLDHWIARERGERYDRGGQWAAGGTIDSGLLARLRGHPFLAIKPPKSTGKEAFNLSWLDARLAETPGVSAQDVQATLVEFSATTIADAVPGHSTELFVCGGGAENAFLMQRLAANLPGVKVGTTAALGCDPAWVEAAAFAWLAWRTLAGQPGNLPRVTGASGPRVLGAVFSGDAGAPVQPV
jgi:anhydro-N-acetylmuramic acid kinase